MTDRSVVQPMGLGLIGEARAMFCVVASGGWSI